MPGKSWYPAGKIEARSRSGSSYVPSFFGLIDENSCFIDGQGKCWPSKNAFCRGLKKETDARAKNANGELIPPFCELYYVDGPYKGCTIAQGKERKCVFSSPARSLIGRGVSICGEFEPLPSNIPDDPSNIDNDITAFLLHAAAATKHHQIPSATKKLCTSSKHDGICKLGQCKQPCFQESGKIHAYCSKTHALYDWNRITSANRDDTCKLYGCTRKVYRKSGVF